MAPAPRASQPSLVPDRVVNWCTRSVRLGVVLGLCLGVLDQVIVPAFGSAPIDGGPAPGFAERVVGLLLTAAGYGLVLLLSSVVLAAPLRWKAGRWGAVVVTSALAAVLFAAHLLAVVVRFLSGSYVTLGAVEFCLNSWHHFVHAALVGYPGYTASWFGVSLAFAALSGVYMFRTFRLDAAGARATRGLYVSGVVLGVVIALGVTAPVPSAFAAATSRTTPELVMMATLDNGDSTADRIVASKSEKGSVPRVEPGPPLSAGRIWNKAIAAAPHNGPNVIMLTLESISIHHLGYFGYPRAATPNLDKLAQQSLRMRRTWTTATHSNYAQPAIISSLFPRRGYGFDVYKRLDYPRVLLHDMFHRMGYATATITSQDESWQGMQRFETTSTPTFFWDSANYQGYHIDTGSERDVPDDKTVDELEKWISSQHGHWALYVDLQATHFPYKLPPGAPAPFQPSDPTPGAFTYLGYPRKDRQKAINRYDNALHYVDIQIGRIAHYLEQTGQLDSTLWVITADHGEMFFDHGMVTHGKTLYEGESRVPLLVHWPDRVKPANVDEPVSTLDILPTIADLVGVPPHPAFQGRSFVNPAEHAEEHTAIFMNIQGLRSADGIVCWPWKLIVERTGREVHLFNLEKDPGELHDLVGKNLRVATALVNTLETQMRAQVAYHRLRSTTRKHRYAPRLLTCPLLPGGGRAAIAVSRPGAAPGPPPPPPTRAR